MRLDLHARVLTRDGEPVGNLDRAIVDPRTNEVTDFVVSTGGFFGKDVIVPHEDIDQASAEGDALRLRLDQADLRSEEHTSELQSLRHLVCRLLLEKK